jgi:hypothetical protein
VLVGRGSADVMAQRIVADVSTLEIPNAARAPA